MTNYNINTAEGIENSKRWMQNMLDQCVTDTLVWYIPMIGGRYIIEIEDKTYTSDRVHSETDRVLGAMGFKRVESIH